MKTTHTTSDLKQRVFRLGYQKIEEEDLLKKIREKVKRLRPKNKDKCYLPQVPAS